jgi:hypothetical protein
MHQKNEKPTQLDKPSQAESDAQRAKKRAWDRAAQRTLRQKTRVRIEHLEKTVQALEEERHGTVIPKLMDEIEALRTENERLRKVIGDSISFLQQGSQVKAGAGAQPSREIPISASSNIATTSGSVSGGDGPWESPQREDQMAMTIRCAGMSPQSDEYGSPFKSTATFDVFNTTCPHEIRTTSDGRCSPNSCIFEMLATLESPLNMSPSMIINGSGAAIPNNTSAFADSNLLSRFPITPTSCMAWRAGNQIFKGISQVDVIEALATDAVDAGPLLKGIHLGWDSLSPTTKLSPCIRILQQMDQCIWAPMPKINRAAIAYKSHMLIRCFLNPDIKNLSSMPEWERPRPLQLCVDHPVVTDFFPWPALRERLILDQDLYLNTCDFFSSVRAHFRFHWPYRFEDAFFVEEKTGAYRASPLFVQQVRNLENWTMAPQFFEAFPDLREDIHP